MQQQRLDLPAEIREMIVIPKSAQVNGITFSQKKS